jgi:hypothetical protein
MKVCNVTMFYGFLIQNQLFLTLGAVYEWVSVSVTN